MAADKLTATLCRPLLGRLLALLQAEFGDDLLAVALFGSVARGHGGPLSDLDLLIVHRGPREAALDRFLEVTRELRDGPEYKRLMTEGFLPDPYPVFLSVDELERHPWLLLDVVDHGIILFDPQGRLGDELRRVGQRLADLGARKVTLPDGTWYWDLKPDWKPGETVEI